MPVISSRRYSTTTGSALPPTGSYRTSLDRPYYSSTTGTYITPRVSSYSRSSALDAYRSENITRNTTTQSPVTTTYRKYSRDVTDSGSRFIRSDSRSREISIDSGITSKSDPLPRSEAALNRALATSAADIINKYSPANYIPKCELVRSRSLSESRQIKEKSQVKSSPCNHAKAFGVNSLYCNNTECTGNIINTNVSLGVQGVPLSVVNSTNSNLYGPSCSGTPVKVKPIFRTHPETGRTSSNLVASSVYRKSSNLLEKPKVMKTTVPIGKASVSSFRSKTKPEPISKVKVNFNNIRDKQRHNESENPNKDFDSCYTNGVNLVDEKTPPQSNSHSKNINKIIKDNSAFKVNGADSNNKADNINIQSKTFIQLTNSNFKKPNKGTSQLQTTNKNSSIKANNKLDNSVNTNKHLQKWDNNGNRPESVNIAQISVAEIRKKFDLQNNKTSVVNNCIKSKTTNDTATKSSIETFNNKELVSCPSNSIKNEIIVTENDKEVCQPVNNSCKLEQNFKNLIVKSDRKKVDTEDSSQKIITFSQSQKECLKEHTAKEITISSLVDNSDGSRKETILKNDEYPTKQIVEQINNDGNSDTEKVEKKDKISLNETNIANVTDQVELLQSEVRNEKCSKNFDFEYFNGDGKISKVTENSAVVTDISKATIFDTTNKNSMLKHSPNINEPFKIARPQLICKVEYLDIKNNDTNSNQVTLQLNGYNAKEKNITRINVNADEPDTIIRINTIQDSYSTSDNSDNYYKSDINLYNKRSPTNHTTDIPSFIPVEINALNVDSKIPDLKYIDSEVSADLDDNSDLNDLILLRNLNIGETANINTNEKNNEAIIINDISDLNSMNRQNQSGTMKRGDNSMPSTSRRSYQTGQSYQSEPTRERVVAIRNTLPTNISTRAGSIDDDDSAAGLNGLRNIGNTCFMNSVLQCLSNTRLLVEFLRRDGYIGEISANGGALIRAFSAVIGELWGPGNSRVVNTSQLKSQVQRFAPRFMGYAQQDAQEFLRYLLEGLHEDVNKVKTKPPPILTEIDDKLSDEQKAAESWSRYVRCEDSRIVELFVGQLKSTLRCTVCGHSSVTFDPFWDLSLPIPSRVGQLRLSQCLELFTKEEVLDGDEKPTCSKCQVRRKCTKSFCIQKFPKILVIHLKRFSPTERFRGKLNIHVDCPLKGLDMSSYAANQGVPCTYNLYAISNHSGTTYSGHYTAYCKHPYTNEWHEYNDSRNPRWINYKITIANPGGKEGSPIYCHDVVAEKE